MGGCFTESQNRRNRIIVDITNLLCTVVYNTPYDVDRSSMAA